MKNYIGWVNDHSGSMLHLAKAAMNDYNNSITATKNAASREMLDTVVSVVGVGVGSTSRGAGYGCTRQVTISNPHVLKPITSWSTDGGTPLYDGIGNMIELFESLPDANDQNVSFLILTTTDGAEMHSSTKWADSRTLSKKIAELQATGRWTFVFRVPAGKRGSVSSLGVPLDNVQEWETTAAGMAQSTAQTTAAMDGYFAARSAGVKSSSAFYTNAAAVNTAALTDVSPETSLYIVPATAGRLEIKDFILQHRKQYLKGAAFYQLVKTEARIGPKKIVLVRDRATGKVFAGQDARSMLSLPNDPTSNARVHPGEHGKYDIFVQSESLNRLLPAGTGVIYWEKQGVPFTQEDIAKFAPKVPVAAAPAVPVLPAVNGRTKPTPSPVPKAVPQPASTDTMNGKRVVWFKKRDDARAFARTSGKTLQGEVRQFEQSVHTPQPRGPNGERWFVYL